VGQHVTEIDLDGVEFGQTHVLDLFVMRAAVGGDGPAFLHSDLLKALNMTTDDLAGVWAGLTKRTRTILGDKKAKLIIWGGG
jgi:hypothetical protein